MDISSEKVPALPCFALFLYHMDTHEHFGLNCSSAFNLDLGAALFQSLIADVDTKLYLAQTSYGRPPYRDITEFSGETPVRSLRVP